LSLWPLGYRSQFHEELDSTNEEARRLAQCGELDRLWIVAERQTSGRGRRGRPWQTQKGNLAATLLLRPEAPSDVRGQLSFVAALAVADMVEQYLPDASITVKWPNDVLANGKKLSGILLEGGNGWLAVGIGINLVHHPEDTEFPATSIAELGPRAPSTQEGLVILATHFAHWYDVWRRQGFGPVREKWLERAKGLGGPICARLSQEVRNGVFEGIDLNGALLLNEGGRVRAIAAGEVFF
jgi:BirA family transcriptional regulator, biotin operon repressor / biotin---[acetyl-CoA-carboxylase] ligase